MENSDRIHSNVWILCADTVVKIKPYETMLSEARTLKFIQSHTSIPVPRVRRLVRSNNSSNGFLLLEKIEGCTPLDKLWPSFSASQRFLVASTLRRYINELRQASDAYYRRHVPGPMADIPKKCHGSAWLFRDMPRSPFKSSNELMDHFKMTFGQQFDMSDPLVLTHGDLSMRNILVGRDGKLWVVDWEWSGFYPQWFEYIAAMSAANNDDAPRSWWNHIPVVTGAWVKEKNMLGRNHF